MSFRSDINIKRGITSALPVADLESRQHSFPKYSFYIETYGCQMNVADSELVIGIMQSQGHVMQTSYKEADIIFINTCAIRDNAEKRVRSRLNDFKPLKQNKKVIIGVLGCMAERLKTVLLEEERLVDLIAGPDAYKSLPYLISRVESGRRASNTFLSREETYADIAPVRMGADHLKAYISIMRGCDNMCSFCVVPFTRGRERSRDIRTILQEVKYLSEQGYKEITLLGQNVDSYKFIDPANNNALSFASLLHSVATVDPNLRVRFSTSHPKDITHELLHVMASHSNICRHIHLPVQSGSDRVLALMMRRYTLNDYMQKVEAIKQILPDCAISTDIIAGFCTETEQDHKQTLRVMEAVKYNYAYMFAYSERPGTLAAKKLIDDVPLEVKKNRLTEIINLQRKHSYIKLQAQIGTKQRVLVEGRSRKSLDSLCGRNTQNDMVVFKTRADISKGSYVDVLINSSTSATLIGEIK